MTLTKDGGRKPGVLATRIAELTRLIVADVPPPDLIKQGESATPFYADMRIIAPIIVFSIIGLLVSAALTFLCMRHSKHLLLILKSLETVSFIYLKFPES